MPQPGYLLLEDGRRFDGFLSGHQGTALGEVVFNTSMSGYQEILTDPSYSGQLVTMTYPMIGNYGVTSEDEESSGPQVSGFIVRELARRPSNWRSTGTLEAYLERYRIVAMSGVDTRALTRHIRSQGAMRGGIAPGEVEEEDLLERILAHPRMEGLDLVGGVSTLEPYEVEPSGEERYRVLAYDLGVKRNSPRLMSEAGCRVTVLPATASADEILAMNPDGFFVSNGPGDPGAVEHAREAILALSERDVPVFGICLGHQLIARAFGARTFKLPFGHHGGNHPVRNLERGTVEITAQNHGFAVEMDREGRIVDAPELEATHLNLYDGTLEGLRHRELPVFSVQYHPEAAPGPHDSGYLFEEFIEMMSARASSGS